MMNSTDSFAIVHFPHNPTVSADDIIETQFNESSSIIKTQDLDYEGKVSKPSEVCGILGFVDDQGMIHLTSNFEIYQMRPKLTDFNPSPQKSSNGDSTISLTRADLDEKFGTEKKRRSVHANKRNTIESSVLQSAVSEAREQVNIQTQESENDKSDNHNITLIDEQDQDGSIPKVNYAAEKPEDVFNLDEVVTENDLSHLTDLCHSIVDANKDQISKWLKDGTYPSFVCDQMRKLPNDHVQRIAMASKILYLHYLIAFFKRSMFKRLPGKPFPDDAPRPLHEKALQLYAVTNINERTRKKDNIVPPRLRLKLTAHICILALHLCRFTVDLDNLRLSLGSSISASKLQDLFSELGCKTLKVMQTNKTKTNDMNCLLSFSLADNFKVYRHPITMVNVGLVEAILREQDDPGASTTRKIREIYNNRSGEDPIQQHSDVDKQFQSVLLKALEKFTAKDNEEDDQPISYTVKLKDGDESQTPVLKRRSIIKLSKEKSQSESDEALSDSEKIQTNSSITINKPFSPLFLNNMKKFGVSTDWLAKRSNSARHSSYSRSSVKSNSTQLDAMIKSASAKPIKSSRKLSFVESSNNNSGKLDFDKENVDPNANEQTENNDQQTEKIVKNDKTTPYDIQSETSDEENEKQNSSPSKDFSLRIERVDLVKKKNKKRSSSSSSSSDLEQEENSKKQSQKKRKSKQDTKSSQEKSTPKVRDKNDRAKARIENLKKLLRASGIRSVIRNSELDEFTTDKDKIKHLESLFEKAGFTGSLTLKECEKFRKNREEKKELDEIQETANKVKVKGHVKAGRTLRGRARSPDDWEPPSNKRKRRISSDDDDDNDNKSSTDDEQSTTKNKRARKMEASPEVSENEIDES